MIGNNLIKDFQDQKSKIKLLFEQAHSNNLINQKTFEILTNKIDQDTLTIGVIGQMKCGKSTFLNAFLFNDQLLPTATTPMTAALSIITYGNEKEIEISFYEKEDWNELEIMASNTVEEDIDLDIKVAIESAQEVMRTSKKIQQEIPSLLGTTKRDKIENLIQYVGVNGKYTSIVKSVTIKLPYEWLKGVEIVDTPGFNDPIKSRERVTEKFLKNADVVILMLYAQRAYDQTDEQILLDKVARVGIEKIVLAINKYELNTEGPEALKKNVMDELFKSLKNYGDENIKSSLMSLEPIPFSAELALLSKMDLSKIKADNDLSYHYKQACKDLGLISQTDFYQKSQISQIEKEIMRIITEEKEEILLKRPINLILRNGENRINDINIELSKLKEQKSNLNCSDIQLQEKIQNLEDIERWMNRNFDYTELNIRKAYKEQLSEMSNGFESKKEDARNTIEDIIDQFKGNELKNKIIWKIDAIIDGVIPRTIKELSSNINSRIISIVNTFSNQIEKKVRASLKDSDEIAKEFRYKFEEGFSINSVELSKLLKKQIGNDYKMGQLDYKWYERSRKHMREAINKIFDKIYFGDIYTKLSEYEDKFMTHYKNNACQELMTDFLTQAKEARSIKDNKIQRLNDIEAKINQLEKEKVSFNDKVKEFKEQISLN